MNYYSIFEKLLALKYCVPQYMNFAQTLSESHQNDFFSHKFGPFSENNRPFKVLNHSLDHSNMEFCPLPNSGKHSLRKKCPYSELFWSVFSRIRTQYGAIQSISPCQSEWEKRRPRITPNTDTFKQWLF